MKFSRLLGTLTARGHAPERISLADMPVLLMRAHKVRVTPDGVVFQRRNYWQPHSAAVMHAQELATLQFDCLALADPQLPDFICLIKNSANGHRDGAELGEKAQLLEVTGVWMCPQMMPSHFL